MHPLLARMPVASVKGWPIHPITGLITYHKGVDIESQFEPVYSVLDGVVEAPGFDEKSGTWMAIYRCEKVISIYAHIWKG
jgi:murein DD-endopeptidase MepM/ murein hydrolase activator NlpD